jgi:hypothetical protein
VSAVLAAVESALVAHFAQPPQRASVSFVGVDPMEVLRFEAGPGEHVLVSVGMSRRPMTGADEAIRSPTGPRAELLLRVRAASPGADDVWRSLAVLAAAPAVEGVVYRPGMTVDMGRALGTGATCTGGVLAESSVAPVELADAEVAILQILPATHAELAWARARGVAALRARWQEAGCDLLDLGRRAVELGGGPT